MLNQKDSLDVVSNTTINNSTLETAENASEEGNKNKSPKNEQNKENIIEFPSYDEIMAVIKPIDAENEEKEQKKETNEEKEITEPQNDQILASFNEIEQKAFDEGWLPKEQFKGNKDNWRPAKEWLERGEMLDKINNQNKKIDFLNKQIKQFAEVNGRLATKMFEIDESDLLKKRNEAIENGDVETVTKLDNKLNEYRVEKSNFANISNPLPQISEEVRGFAERNVGWFNGNSPKHRAMTEFAISYESNLRNQMPGLSEKAYIEKTENAIRQTFADEFNEILKNSREPIVEKRSQTASAARTTKKEITFEDLPSNIKTIVKNMCKKNGGALSLDDYTKQLAAIGFLKESN